MLRASSSESEIDEVAHREQLVAFADALARGHDDLAVHRFGLARAIGAEAFVEAAAIAAVFHGYVRVADGTGIPVEELVLATSGDLRDELGINGFSGRRATDLGVDVRPAADFDPGLGT